MTTTLGRSKPSLSDEEINRTLEAAIYEADEERARALQGMRLLQSARVRGQTRYLRRLDSAPDVEVDRARAVAAKLQLDRRLDSALGVEAARARVTVPEPDPEAWILHGHVLHEELDPVPDVLVSLVGTQGARVRVEGGRADAFGYFKLSVAALPAEPADSGPQQQQQQGVAEKRSRRASGARAAAVKVRVLAGRSKVLFEDDTPLTPVAGGVEYAEIMLPEAGKPPRRGRPSTSRSRSTGSSRHASRKTDRA
jgi:hypothetical protein